jgi:hypothetical protein
MEEYNVWLEMKKKKGGAASRLPFFVYMHWSIPGAQAVLNLRTRHRSEQFEQCRENFAAA